MKFLVVVLITAILSTAAFADGDGGGHGHGGTGKPPIRTTIDGAGGEGHGGNGRTLSGRGHFDGASGN